jgi:hypothetical protein
LKTFYSKIKSIREIIVSLGLFLSLFCLPGRGFAKSLFILPIGPTELQLELIGLYYLPLDYHIPLTGEPIPMITPKWETDIYKHLLTHWPRFIVLEASTYPLPLAGIAIKKNYPDFYDSTTYSRNFNLVQSMTSSLFEEPWAASVFFGNVVSFVPLDAPFVEPLAPDDKTKAGKKGAVGGWHNQDLAVHQESKTEDKDVLKGKGYSGFLFSYGNYHIKQNTLIKDQWQETELKLIGSYHSERVFIDWSYRIGARINFHPDIKSYYYIGLKRDHLDYTEHGFSLIKNSQFLFKLSLDAKTLELREIRFLFGKKFPIRDGSVIPEITLGVIWKVSSPYTGALASQKDAEVLYVVSPNLRF